MTDGKGILKKKKKKKKKTLHQKLFIIWDTTKSKIETH